MLLSIIVPVYNVEEYIGECLQSLKKQVFTDYEVIIVNDGSTDGSPAIAKDFTADKRFKMFDKPNGGLMSAWKFGLQRASGEYVGFVDSDDYVEPDMFEVLVKAIQADKSDMACCSYNTVKDGSITKERIFVDSGVYNEEDIKSKIFPALFNTNSGVDFERGLAAARWNKIYKRELLLKNYDYYDERISYGEDLLTTTLAVMEAKRISVLSDEYLYDYRIRGGSLTNKYVANLDGQIDILTEAIKNILLRYNVTQCKESFYRDAFCFQIKRIRNLLASPQTKKLKLKELDKLLNSQTMQTSLPFVKGYYKSFKGKVKYFLIKHKMKRMICKLF